MTGQRAAGWAVFGAVQVAFLAGLIALGGLRGPVMATLPNPPVSVQLHQACSDGIDTMLTNYATAAQCLKAQRPVIESDYEYAAQWNEQAASVNGPAVALGVGGCWAGTDLVIALVYVLFRRARRGQFEVSRG